MAGFVFGNVGELNASVTVQCFVYLVFFIMFFDAFVGVLEYFLQGSPLYHRMIQTIYKELMLMGIVSFIITMILALESYKNTHSEAGTKWIKGIEFAHILLFFLTFFFVGHALFLMRKSIVSRAYYRTTFSQGVSTVLSEAPNIMKNPLEYFLFKFHLFPAIGTKDRMELWLMHELFRDTYWLPHDFNFADYLSGCFDQYILKTIDRSFFTWIVLISLSVLNYARISLHIGFQTCRNPNHESATSHRFLVTMEHNGVTTRLLGGSSGGSSGSTDSSSAEAIEHEQQICNYNMFRLFLFFGGILVIFNLVVVYIARLYRVRMFSRVGVLATNDYADFLEFVQKEDEAAKERKRLGLPIHSDEMTTAQLKSDIQAVLDEDEHGSEEAEFKELAEGILGVLNFVWETKDSIVVGVRTVWNRVVRGVQVRKLNVITPNWDTTATTAAAAAPTDRSPVDIESDHKATAAGGSAGSAGGMTASSSGDLHSEKRDGGHGNANGAPKLSHLHRATARATNLAPSTSAASASAASGGHAEELRTAEHSKTDGSAAGTTAAIAVPVGANGVAGRGRRRTNIAELGAAANPHAQLDSIRAFLQKLDEHPSALPVTRANRGRTNSRDRDDGSASDGKGTLPAGRLPAAAGAGGGSTAAEAASGATGARRTSIVSVNSNRRRNSVQVIHPTNQLSLVERYKLRKAQQDPAYALALRKQHDAVVAEQQRQQAAAAAAESRSASVRWLWSWLPGVSSLSSSDASASGPSTPSTASSPASTSPTTDIEQATAAKDVKDLPNDAQLVEYARLNVDFHSVYVFGEPTYFIRAIEIAIMFNCLYMAFWLSNFITIAGDTANSHDWEILHELAMLIPITVVMPCVTYISETASLLSAISELNLHVIYQVLCDTEDTQNLLRDFRKKLRARIVALQSHNFDKDEVLRILFEEIDRDGSGVIDPTEFRLLLRHLKLKYSDDRFKRLFHAIAGDTEITFEELKKLVDAIGEDDDDSTSGNGSGGGGGRGGAAMSRQGSSSSSSGRMAADAAVSSSSAAAGSAGHSRSSGVQSIPTRLSMAQAPPPSSSSANRVARFHPVEEEDKSDDDEDGDGDDDIIYDACDLKPSEIQQRQSFTNKLRSVSSVDYSDTDSDEEAATNANGGDGKQPKRRSHRSSGRKRHASQTDAANGNGSGNHSPTAAATSASNGSHSRRLRPEEAVDTLLDL